MNPDVDYPTLYRFFVQLWICLGLAWLSLFFSWNVHMVLEAHKVLKKRRLRRHRHPIDDSPETEPLLKKSPKPPPVSGVIDIFKFMSEKVEDYSDVIQAIGADEKRRRNKTGMEEPELARSKSCSDLLNGLVIPLDHSPRLKRRFSVSANMCMVTNDKPTEDLNKNQEEQKLPKETHKDFFCAVDMRKSDPSVFQSPTQSPNITNNRDSRFLVYKVPEDQISGRRKSTG